MRGAEDNLGHCNGGGGQQSYAPNYLKRQAFYISLFFVFVVISGFWIWVYLSEPPSKYSESNDVKTECCTHQEQAFKPKIDGEESQPDNINQTRYQLYQKKLQVRGSDLAAQRGMWRATNVVAAVAFLQCIATLIGLYWIRITLAATQSTLMAAQASLIHTEETARQSGFATDAANRTADAAQAADRAYIYPTRVALVRNGGKYYWVIDWTNNGNTPAEEFSQNINWIVSGESDEIGPLDQAQFSDQPDNLGPKQVYVSLLAIEGERLNQLDSRIRSNGHVFVWGSTIYKDAFRKTSKARVCFKMIPNDGEFTLDLENTDFSIRQVQARWIENDEDYGE